MKVRGKEARILRKHTHSCKSKVFSSRHLCTAVIADAIEPRYHSSGRQHLQVASLEHTLITLEDGLFLVRRSEDLTLRLQLRLLSYSLLSPEHRAAKSLDGALRNVRSYLLTFKVPTSSHRKCSPTPRFQFSMKGQGE
jgi:hypothetical protein